MQVLGGAGSGRARKQVEQLLAALPILPFDEAAGRAAAEVRRGLESKGKRLGMGDYLIVGICLSRSAPLLTRNLARFSRVPELRLDPLFQE